MCVCVSQAWRPVRMLESYVSPLLMSYVNRYIKNLKPSDLQLSLWGGDVVLSKLDLRLDVLEQVRLFLQSSCPSGGSGNWHPESLKWSILTERAGHLPFSAFRRIMNWCDFSVTRISVTRALFSVPPDHFLSQHTLRSCLLLSLFNEWYRMDK